MSRVAAYTVLPWCRRVGVIMLLVEPAAGLLRAGKTTPDWNSACLLYRAILRTLYVPGERGQDCSNKQAVCGGGFFFIVPLLVVVVISCSSTYLWATGSIAFVNDHTTNAIWCQYVFFVPTTDHRTTW